MYARLYRPYRARAVTQYLPVVQSTQPVGVSHARGYCHTGATVSRNLSLWAGLLSDLSSGSCCEYSLSVGILIVIVRLVMTVEHLNYACHP